MDRLDAAREPEGREVRGGARGPSAVVVGVGGTTTAGRAVSYVAGVAARNHARLVLVHVRPLPVVAWTGFRPWFPVLVECGAECSLLDDARKAVGRMCGTVEAVLRTGDPVIQLCEVAQDRSADVIVVGSPLSVRHRFWGSVPTRLAKRGHWPIVVVP